MNKNIKQITTGAMFLSIYGALLLLDRFIGFSLADILPSIGSAFIIVYFQKYHRTMTLAVGILIIGFLLGNLTTQTYTVTAVLIGLFCCYYFNGKRVSNKKLFRTLTVVYFLMELLICMVVNPLLFDLPLKKQLSFSIALYESIGFTSMAYPLALLSILMLILIVAICDTWLLLMYLQLLLKRNDIIKNDTTKDKIE